MKTTEISEISVSQLFDLISQIKGCANLLLDAAENASRYCDELKTKKERIPEEVD